MRIQPEMTDYMDEWYTISYSVLLGLAGIFFTLFTVIYALIDNKQATISLLEDLRRQGKATPPQLRDISYWNKCVTAFQKTNIHVLILLGISIVLCILFIILKLWKIQYPWLTIGLIILEVGMVVYMAFVLIQFIKSYFDRLED